MESRHSVIDHLVISNEVRNLEAVEVEQISLVGRLASDCTYRYESRKERSFWIVSHNLTFESAKKETATAPSRNSGRVVSRLAPRAGLEPATSRLQDPQSFDWAWTISSPACQTDRGGCRALMRRYWIGSSASSLCTFLRTPSWRWTVLQASLRIPVPHVRGRLP